MAGSSHFLARAEVPSHLRDRPSPPPVRFTDITEAAGITFTHVNGAADEKLLPETMGSGCAFFDYDGDADQDLLLVNSGYLRYNPEDGRRFFALTLYQNDGRGKFRDVTVGSGLEATFYGMGTATADYDNDGRCDVFVTAVGQNHLFHNEGQGRFREVTAPAGVGGSSNQWATGCGWFDYDRDGLLDLFVCRYLDWSRELDKTATNRIGRIKHTYALPVNFDGAFPSLYRNEGNGKFRDVAASAGLHIKDALGKPTAKSVALAPVDLDEDGWMDVMVVNDTVPNMVFRNERNGKFKEIGSACGLGYDAFGNVRRGMGVDTAWFGDDATLGIAVANCADEMNAFYVPKRGSLKFMDEGPTEGLGAHSRPHRKFGLLFIDYDLDGWPDLLTANGHLEPDVATIDSTQSYAQPPHLFRNGGPQQEYLFTPVTTEHADSDLFRPLVGRGAACADIDDDGDLDVLITQNGRAPVLLRNDQPIGHKWLRVKLIGTRSNRDAVGARVTLRSATRMWQAQVMPTRSYLSQCALPVTLGFGEGRVPSELEVRWPKGKTQRVKLEPGRNRVTVVERGKRHQSRTCATN